MEFPSGRDRAAAERLIAAFPGADGAGLRAVLDCLGGNSPFLAELALREANSVRMCLAQGPDAVCDIALGTLARLSPETARPLVASALREAKRRIALAAAIADIGGAWSLEQVTGALSDLAETALRVAVRHLLFAACARGELRLPHPAAPDKGCGFTVLAMGKLGARELNFSSDVDLILLWDAGAHPYTEDTNGATFARLARDLVAMMQTREPGGYVFRTDLRLRPDPASTPLAVRLEAALSYYESTAQAWERAAMIKARPVAGDLALGRRFLEAIRSFIWRRHLDFAAIADIQAMKAQVDSHKDTALGDGDAVARLLGHDLKIGEGGIREIEFFAQSLQLVWGGRDPQLRVRGTLAALQAATDAGHVREDLRHMLAESYRTLRRAEHRLQMVADRQTHALPCTRAGLADFVAFLGESNAENWAAAMLARLQQVRAAFSGLLAAPAEAPDLGKAPARAGRDAARGPDTSMAADGTGPHRAIGGTSAAKGGSAAGRVHNVVSSGPAPAATANNIPTLPGGTDLAGEDGGAIWTEWLNGRPRALRTERARALLRDLLPALRRVVASQPDPRLVWLRLDEFIHRLPAGVQFFSLLQHNPALLERLGGVLGAAPSLADHLAAVPAALEGFLAPQPVDPQPRRSLAAELHDAAALDDALAAASRFVRGEEFRLGVAELDGRIDQDVAGEARTALADAAIGALLPRVLAAHRQRYGRVKGGGLAVVALGKAGSREMMAGSDLDLMLIYDHPDGLAESDGRTKIAASQYFARLAQALVAALTVPTRDGKLYDVDMRLRPSGGKGPVAVSLASFTHYHRESAWTWERLALTRARVVAGPRALRAEVALAIGHALRQDPVRRDTAAEGRPGAGSGGIAAETCAMRKRLLTDLPPHGAWDIKLRRGGLMELEFIAQSLQLRHGASKDVFDPCTRAAFGKLAKAGVLHAGQAKHLVAADAAWRALQGLMRIAIGRAVPVEVPPPLVARMMRALDRIPGLPLDGGLPERVEAISSLVSAAFLQHVGDTGEV